ncbi:MAG: PIN domain-containing protein [Candidatus Eremiobacterota bacterium]
MNNNSFLDTNILIYAYSISELNKKNKSIELLNHKNIILSTQVINEFVWIMSRKYNVDLIKLDMIVKTLFDTYRIVLIDKQVIELAIKLSIKYNFSYWDGLILSASLVNECNIIYTEDLQHGQIIDKNLTILNPFTDC